jgi:hypothetical protein
MIRKNCYKVMLKLQLPSLIHFMFGSFHPRKSWTFGTASRSSLSKAMETTEHEVVLYLRHTHYLSKASVASETQSLPF